MAQPASERPFGQVSLRMASLDGRRHHHWEDKEVQQSSASFRPMETFGSGEGDEVQGGTAARSRRRNRRRSAETSRGAQTPALPHRPKRDPSPIVQITIRLSSHDVARVDARAAAAGLSRCGWVLALVRNHLDQAPKFRRQDEVAIIGIYDQLRRIANHLTQRSQLISGQSGDQPDAQKRAELETLTLEIRMHMTALKTAFKGNLDSWRIADE